MEPISVFVEHRCAMLKDPNQEKIFSLLDKSGRVETSGPGPHCLFVKLFQGVKHPPCGGLNWLQPEPHNSRFWDSYKPLIYWYISYGVSSTDPCDMSPPLVKAIERQRRLTIRPLSPKKHFPTSEKSSPGSRKAIVTVSLGEAPR